MSPEKKGLHPLAWVGIGCGVLIVLGGVVFVALTMFVFGKAKDALDQPVTMTARAIALANPDIEFVSADEENRTVVFRNKDTGEESRFDFSDVEAGRIEFTGSEGTVSIGAEADGQGVAIRGPDGQTARFGAGDAEDIPDFVPRMRQATYESAFSMTSDGVTAGTASLSTSEAPSEVAAFYKRELTSAGWEVSETTTTANGVSMYIVTGTKGDSQVSVMTSDDGSGTRGTVSYSGK
jgi:hypothetical protein